MAVNAGSNEISSFVLEDDALTLAGTFDTTLGGAIDGFPVSIAEYEGLVYVLNAAGDGAVLGYTLQDDCSLAVIPESEETLDWATRTLRSLSALPPKSYFLL